MSSPAPAPPPSAAPAPAQPEASTSVTQAPAVPAVAAVAVPKAPEDAATQAELRKKLEGSRRDLRGYLEKKKRIDRELVSLGGLWLCAGKDWRRRGR